MYMSQEFPQKYKFFVGGLIKIKYKRSQSEFHFKADNKQTRTAKFYKHLHPPTCSRSILQLLHTSRKIVFLLLVHPLTLKITTTTLGRLNHIKRKDDSKYFAQTEYFISNKVLRNRISDNVCSQYNKIKEKLSELLSNCLGAEQKLYSLFFNSNIM